jgi:hypothetical protein
VKRGNEKTRSAGKCGQIYGGASVNRDPLPAGFNGAINRLISRDYFLIGRFCIWSLQIGHAWNLLS